MILNKFKKMRLKKIDDEKFPLALIVKFQSENPEYSDNDILKITEGLKDYFRLCLLNEGKTIEMPSRCVDDLWHQFILFTKDYHIYTKNIFDKYLHHFPYVSSINATNEIENAYRMHETYIYAKQLDEILGRKDSMPALFTIDEELNIEKRIKYDFDKMKHLAEHYKSKNKNKGSRNSKNASSSESWSTYSG
ncbi:hypothetical protein A3715_19860, partial [Oleiphilus sp. HI0009]